MSYKKKNKLNWKADPNNASQPMGPFDRTILFSCFSPWVESIRQQRQTDPEKAADAFLALADYCLYAKEPDPATNPWGMAWPMVKHDADASIKNRSRRFGTEDLTKQEKIKNFFLEYPDATQREAEEATGCSLGLVNKVHKKLARTSGFGACSIDYDSNSNPRGSVLEQSTIPDDDDPALDEVLGPHQPDAQPKEANV